jgi:hypothetical protein
MTERPAILAAKIEKLAEIVADGQEAKEIGTVSEAREAQQAATSEVLSVSGSVADVEAVETPTERLQ